METHDPTMVENDHCLEQEVHVTAGCAQVQMHVTDWAKAQREDPALSAVLDRLGVQKKDRFKNSSGGTVSNTEGQMILQNQQNF